MKNRLHLDRIGIIILAITLILSTTFFIIGGIIISDENDDYYYDYYGSSSSSSSNSSSSSSYPTYTVYSGTTKYIYRSYGDYCDITFYCSSTGSYTIKMDGAYITSMKNSYSSSVSYSSSYNSLYDYAYTTYLYSGNTYTIRIYITSSSSSSFLISYS